MDGKFDLTQSDNGKFRFTLKAGNGQVILTSQGYAAKKTALDGIESTRVNSQNDDRFDRKESSASQPYFNLLAINGQIIGTSQMYKSAAARENGIESVKSHAPEADLDDLTSA